MYFVPCMPWSSGAALGTHHTSQMDCVIKMDILVLLPPYDWPRVTLTRCVSCAHEREVGKLYSNRILKTTWQRPKVKLFRMATVTLEQSRSHQSSYKNTRMKKRDVYLD